MARIFISYARSDAQFANKLAADLRAAGVSLWIDQRDILPGERWDDAVQTALTMSPALLVILSPNSVGSENVMDEVAEALKRGKKIVPVLYRPCDIPFRIGRLQHIDLTNSYQDGLNQLVAALSPGPPGPAGIEGTAPPPERVAAAKKPSTRRWPIIAAGALGSILVVAGILGVLHWMRPAEDVTGRPPWCNDTQYAAEVTICATKSLWPLDAELRRAYGVAVGTVELDPAKFQELQQSEGRWLRGTRNPCETDVACLTKVYNTRLAALSGDNTANPPSFCNGTANSPEPAERTICSSKALWPLDAELDQIYKTAQAKAGAESAKLAALQKTEELWLNGTRNSCGSDAKCLEDAYKRRITALRAFK